MNNSTVLYKKAKTGKISIWEVWIETDNNDIPVIMRKSGYIDGKQNIKKRYVRKGTNKGKKNEKTPLEHAEFLKENMVKERIEDNMVRNMDEVDLPPKFIYPALAKKYSSKKVKFPCFGQKKLDGVRCVQFNHLNDDRLLSRQRKEFKLLQHIKDALEQENITGNKIPIDGEIYIHGFNFEDIISRVKKYYEGNNDGIELNTKDLEYHIYDIPLPGALYIDRKRILDQRIPDDHPILKKVETYQINSWEEIKEYHDKWVAEGYEGIIIRLKDGLYAFNDRDYTLMKYKEFIDEEFLIVDFEHEEYYDIFGIQHNLVIWVCETEEGARFTVRPRGSFWIREKLYNNAQDHILKNLTVRYQEKTSDGIPRFGVGVKVDCFVRNYE